VRDRERESELRDWIVFTKPTETIFMKWRNMWQCYEYIPYCRVSVCVCVCVYVCVCVTDIV